MQELVKRLDDFVYGREPSDDLEGYFRKAAARWAAFVVEHNTGIALDAGIDISKAMIRYADGIK
uniref:Uncharacterized protein n=1 Tax=viral metagenome TaxID=1070528 RepID=A0A6M3JNE3_9ZZZZ